jgi:hypothetical protein
MPVQTRGAAKRPRDEGEVSEDEPAAKRPTPSPAPVVAPSTPFFRRVEPSFHERARSARKATPARSIRPIKAYSAIAPDRFRDEPATDASDVVPARAPEVTAQQDEPAVNEITPPTPTPEPQQSTVGWLWNSAKKLIPKLRSEDDDVPVATSPVLALTPAQPQPASDQADLRDPTLPPIDWANPPYFRSEPLDPRVQDRLESIRAARRIRNNPNQIDSHPLETFFKRHPLPTADNMPTEDDNTFNTVQVPGSNKRKLTDEPEPRTPSNSFQPPSVEDEDEEDAQGMSVATPSKQPQTPAPLFQRTGAPLKSAMWTGTKAKRTVGFDESTIRGPQTEPPKKRVKVYKDLGPAGHYTGFHFRDPADYKNKTVAQDPLFTPKSRTVDLDDDTPFYSSNPKFHQPNSFGLTLEDLEADPEDITPEIEAAIARAEAADAAKKLAKAQEEAARAAEAARLAEAAVTAPPPPSAPRPSHAELPSPIKPVEAPPKPHQTAQEQIEQQRKLLTKYKPKNSSGLARVEPARSRSSSPPRASQEDVPALVRDGDISDEPPSPTPPSGNLTGDIGSDLPRDLDNTTRGDDGMTDYEREHQYDEWARNLDWPEPQTYVEAGLCSAYIDELIRKKWTEEDDRITAKFWGEEFADVERLMEEARGRGQVLELVYGEDAEMV